MKICALRIWQQYLYTIFMDGNLHSQGSLFGCLTWMWTYLLSCKECEMSEGKLSPSFVWESRSIFLWQFADLPVFASWQSIRMHISSFGLRAESFSPAVPFDFCSSMTPTGKMVWMSAVPRLFTPPSSDVILFQLKAFLWVITPDSGAEPCLTLRNSTVVH